MLNKLLDNKGKKTILVALIVAVLGWAGYSTNEQNIGQYVDLILNVKDHPSILSDQEVENLKNSAKPNFNKASHISPQRRTHILYGDATGGGHLFGTGKPCKSEFPAHWNEETVIREVELIAANDNLNWQQQRNGYHVTEHKVGTVNVRVVKGRKGEQVITAYPTNVPRNPCPANDNH